jgi:hypothetical protein
MRFSALNQNKSKQSGSVLTEFAILVPMLVVFFLGLVGIGQLLGQVTWIAQTAYSGAVFAADTPREEGPAKVRAETAKLKALQYRGQINPTSPNGGWTVQTNYSSGALTGQPIITVNVNAHISPIVRSIMQTDIGASAVMPLLVPGMDQFAGMYSFANPTSLTGCPIDGCVTKTNYDTPKDPKLAVDDPVKDQDKYTENFVQEVVKSLEDASLQNDPESALKDVIEKYSESANTYDDAYGNVNNTLNEYIAKYFTKLKDPPQFGASSDDSGGSDDDGKSAEAEAEPVEPSESEPKEVNNIEIESSEISLAN